MRRKNRLPGDSDVTYAPALQVRSIDGHLLRTGEEVWAWYRLPPQRWSFRADADREHLISTIANRYAELSGRWLHLRVTARPYPVASWAQAHAENADGRLPDTSGALSFADYLVGEQHHLAESGHELVSKEVYLGVQVRARSMVDRLADLAAPLLSRVWSRGGRALAESELVAADTEVGWLDQIVAAQGLEARPVSAEEMSWLMGRSCALGLPAPLWEPAVPSGVWETSDLARFADVATMYHEPYAPTVTVRGLSGAYATHTRNVAVCSIGQMEPLRIPEHSEPWLQRADRLGGVEVSARIYVCRSEEVTPALTRQMNKVRSQVRHYTNEHDLEPPRSLARQAAQVLDIEDEMSRGFTATSVRVRSWWRIAVSGADEDDALARARELAEIYKPQISIEHPEGQYGMAREFIPGEGLAGRVHQRQGSVLWAAAAVPQATAQVGDQRGIVLGRTSSATTSPVTWDPWMGQELRDSSGLTAVVGGLGSGKSFLGGGIVYKTLRSGARWDVLDPSGQLTALCRLPELAPYARAIDLLDAEPGILNPYRVVSEPALADFSDAPDPHRAWTKECAIAAATRRRLVLDAIIGLLPYEIARMPQTRIVVLRAVRDVGGRFDAHPGMVFDRLRTDSSEHREHAAVVADFLDEMRERLSLLIPQENEDPYAGRRDDRLTVLTMNGLVLPKEGIDREYWTDAETLGIQLLNLAAWLVQRSVYDRPRNERKGVWIDEAFFLSRVATGRVLMDRFNRDSRKWNIRVLLSSQIPADFLAIQGFASLVDSVFVGQLSDAEAQTDALRLLGVAQQAGYEQLLGSLSPRRAVVPRIGTGAVSEGPARDTSPRQFVFSDGAGGIERVRIDFGGEHLAGLRQALETAPRAGVSHSAAAPALTNGHGPKQVALAAVSGADLEDV